MPQLDRLTSAELAKALKATDDLLTVHEKVPILDPMTTAQIDTLRADLTANQEDRRTSQQSKRSMNSH
jgi:hypothetical protein